MFGIGDTACYEMGIYKQNLFLKTKEKRYANTRAVKQSEKSGYMLDLIRKKVVNIRCA